ncbi:hypothetical protein Tco_0724775 [Tanacetum coccineum]|uniref:Reverse transcriptase domain-containing protein n=1 Tax=Tanacetum coccineum TaxID=301880 RepID=A0ABQ4YB12_9ASTR
MTSRPRTRVFRPGPVWGCDRLVSRAKVIENQVMVAPVISILSDLSEESVGSHAPRVILFGAIPAIIPVIPEVPVVPANPIVAPEEGTISVVSPSGVLDLVDYSPSSDSDSSEDSLPPVPDLPLVLPFLCSDDTKADGESEPAEQRPVSSSRDTLAPLSEFPLAPVVAPLGIRRLRPVPARRLAWRRVSYHSSDSSSSSAPSDHSLSRHTPPDTTDADSSTLHRFVYRSLARTLRHSSSSERLLDSSSPSSRPSRKRCRFHTASVPSPTYVSMLISPTPPDLLPPRKRFRDSYSPEDSKEEHMEVDTTDAEAVADVGISEGVVAHPEDGVGMGFEITASDVREDDEEFEAEASAADTREIVVDPFAIGDSSESSRGASGERASLVERIRSLRLEYLKVRAILSIERDRIDSIRWHMALSQEEFRQVHRDRDDTRRRLRRLESTMTITRSGMTPEAIEELVNRRVEEALAAHEATRAANALEAENQSQNGSDDDNGNGDNKNGENGNGGNGNPNENGSGDRPVARECTYQDFMTCQPLKFLDGDNGNGDNRNGENGNGGNGNPNENGSGDRPVARECTYQDFMTCQPLKFKGTKGVVGLIRWFEKMETVFQIRNCPEKYQVKELMKLMTEVYCPRKDIQKMESELWNLTEDRVEKFIGGLPDNIQGNVITAKPTKLQDAVRIANNLMDQKLKGYAVKNAENKIRLEVNQRDNRGQQPPFKRPNVGG